MVELATAPTSSPEFPKTSLLGNPEGGEEGRGTECAVAGVAELLDRTGSRQAIIDFGLPRALASPLGILLPLCELAVAAALIAPPTTWWGAIGALVLLLVFVVGIGANLARGHKPDCRCFGQLHSAPAGPKTLARNAALAAVAALVVWRG